MSSEFMNTRKKVILVTGANGQLGNEMRLVSENSSNQYLFTDVAELDITDLEAVRRMMKDNNVDVVVNCAAYTNVDKAEDAMCFRATGAFLARRICRSIPWVFTERRSWKGRRLFKRWVATP